LITASEIFCLNEQGKRKNNEDSISPQKGFATSRDRVFIVCDGVGGEHKGEVASEIVSSTVHQFLQKQKLIKGKERELIQKAVHLANQKLAEYASKYPSAKRMSTTFALVLLSEGSVLAAWCGDTRIHHIRDGKVLWKSKDHSLVGELVRAGELTEEEAMAHPKKNVITRSLNALNYNNTVDYFEIKNYKSGDYLLLCTDGLLEQINEDRIFSILNAYGEKDKAKGFLQYCHGRTRDNFSMYLVRINEQQPVYRVPVSRIVFLLIIVLVCLFCMTFIYLKNR